MPDDCPAGTDALAGLVAIRVAPISAQNSASSTGTPYATARFSRKTHRRMVFANETRFRDKRRAGRCLLRAVSVRLSRIQGFETARTSPAPTRFKITEWPCYLCFLSPYIPGDTILNGTPRCASVRIWKWNWRSSTGSTADRLLSARLRHHHYTDPVSEERLRARRFRCSRLRP